MKILNLYAGIGGNRKLWSDEHNITAVEINSDIAKVYQDLYPRDKVIIDDAHEFLRKYFREYDFIWASPPCPTHSVLQMTRYHSNDLNFPDMTLWQEIIWLKSFFKGNWVVENVKTYYQPLISPTFIIDRHYYWSNNFILTAQFNDFFSKDKDSVSSMEIKYGFNLDKYKNINKRQVLRNCVTPEIGKYIFENIAN